MSSRGNDAWDTHDAREAAIRAEAQGLRDALSSVWAGFLDFALRDNVLEVAVGLIVATAFTAVVNSLVSDILLPPISLLPWMAKNLGEKFLVLREGPHASEGPYNTRKQALEDGAIILSYGAFLDHIISFLCVGFAMYIIARLYGHFGDHTLLAPKTKKCEWCAKDVGLKAKRCLWCTSWLDGDPHTGLFKPAAPLI